MFRVGKNTGDVRFFTAFVQDLLERAGVLVTPGSAFGKSGEGYVRVALVKDEEELSEAIGRMEKSGIFRRRA